MYIKKAITADTNIIGKMAKRITWVVDDRTAGLDGWFVTQFVGSRQIDWSICIESILQSKDWL